MSRKRRMANYEGVAVSVPVSYKKINYWRESF